MSMEILFPFQFPQHLSGHSVPGSKAGSDSPGRWQLFQSLRCRSVPYWKPPCAASEKPPGFPRAGSVLPLPAGVLSSAHLLPPRVSAPLLPFSPVYPGGFHSSRPRHVFRIRFLTSYRLPSDLQKTVSTALQGKSRISSARCCRAQCMILPSVPSPSCPGRGFRICRGRQKFISSLSEILCRSRGFRPASLGIRQWKTWISFRLYNRSKHSAAVHTCLQNTPPESSGLLLSYPRPGRIPGLDSFSQVLETPSFLIFSPCRFCIRSVSPEIRTATLRLEYFPAPRAEQSFFPPLLPPLRRPGDPCPSPSGCLSESVIRKQRYRLPLLPFPASGGFCATHAAKRNLLTPIQRHGGHAVLQFRGLRRRVCQGLSPGIFRVISPPVQPAMSFPCRLCPQGAEAESVQEASALRLVDRVRIEPPGSIQDG